MKAEECEPSPLGLPFLPIIIQPMEYPIYEIEQEEFNIYVIKYYSFFQREELARFPYGYDSDETPLPVARRQAVEFIERIKKDDLTNMKAEDINTLEEAERFVEGCLNDLIEGISDKTEIMKQLAKYTVRIVQLARKKYQFKQTIE